MLALLLSAVLDAQWLKYPTPGIPRLADGRANLSAPTPRTPDGKPDLSGLWRASVNYISDLTRGTKPGDVVMLPTTDALVRERRENYSRDDPSASCIPGGVPRSDLVSSAYPMRVVTAAGRVIILYEAIHGWREIFTDGRTHPPDMNPTWNGYSIGRWMGDDFVVETAGFNDKGRLDLLGHPRSDRMRITERFRRTDFGHLDVEMTFDDSKNYTKPFTVRIPHTLMADADIFEMFDENEKDCSHIRKP